MSTVLPKRDLVKWTYLTTLSLGVVLGLMVGYSPATVEAVIIGLPSMAMIFYVLVNFIKEGLSFAVPYLMIWSGFSWQIISMKGIEVGALSGIRAQGEFRLYGLLLGAQLALLAIPVISKQRVLRTGKLRVPLPYERWMLIFFVLWNFVGLLIGLGRGNRLIYVLGDTYKMLIIPLGYFLVVTTVKREKIRRVLLLLVFLMVVSELLQMATYIGLLIGGSYQRLRGLLWIDRILLLCLLLMLYLEEQSRQKRILFISILFIVITLGLISLYRAMWVLSALAILLIVIIARNRARVLKSLMGIAAYLMVFVVLAVVAISLTAYGGVLKEKIYDRFVSRMGEIYRGGEFGYSLRAKFYYEPKELLEEFQQSSTPLVWLIGFGNGAEYQSSSEYEGHIKYEPLGYQVHQVHNGYLSILFRMGVFGLALFVLVLLSLFKILLSHLRRCEGYAPIEALVVKVTFVYFVITVIYLNGEFIFFGDLNWAILLGLIGVLHHGSERSSVGEGPDVSTLSPLEASPQG